MTSKTDIARRSLLKLGDRFNVRSFDENSPQMAVIRELFDESRDSVLREYAWSFAKRYIKPAKLAVTIPTERWLHGYAYPTDAVRILSVNLHSAHEEGSFIPRGYRQSGYDPYLRDAQASSDIDYDILNIDGQSVIVTSTDDIEIVYTGRVENFDLWDILAVKALECRLAAMACPALLADTNKQVYYEKMAMKNIQEAQSISSSEGIREDTPEAEWMLARRR